MTRVYPDTSALPAANPGLSALNILKIRQSMLHAVEFTDTGLVDHDNQALQTKWGHRFVILESSLYRRSWISIFFVLLVYTGTFFPWRVCFLELKLPSSANEIFSWRSAAWDNFDIIVDILFGIDCGVNFFFSYRDESRKEVDDLRQVAVRYLETYFSVNLLACLPAEWTAPIIKTFLSAKLGDDIAKVIPTGARMVRLQRAIRLSHFGRLARFLRVTERPLWRWLNAFRLVRVTKFLVSLLWIVHILSCGWYLCAVLHDDPHGTWVSKKTFSAQDSLLDRTAVEQWWRSMCFVLGICLGHYGLGGIFADTTGELVYVAFIMLVGAVMQSIILSEVIHIITHIDQRQRVLNEHKTCVDEFATIAGVDSSMTHELMSWLEHQHKTGSLSTSPFDKSLFREIAVRLPKRVLDELVSQIYAGHVQRNRFLECVHFQPLTVMLFSLELVQRNCEAGEMVYSLHDHPLAIYLVECGIFAYVGTPTPSGGIDEPTDRMEDLYPYQIFCMRNYFGDLELLAGLGHRCCTAKCEESGSLLSLHRDSLFRFMEFCPSLNVYWRRNSRRRDQCRKLCVSKLTKGRILRHFAAATLQDHVRDRFAKSRREHGPVKVKKDAAPLPAPPNIAASRSLNNYEGHVVMEPHVPTGMAKLQSDMNRVLQLLQAMSRKHQHEMTPPGVFHSKTTSSTDGHAKAVASDERSPEKAKDPQDALAMGSEPVAACREGGCVETLEKQSGLTGMTEELIGQAEAELAEAVAEEKATCEQSKTDNPSLALQQDTAIETTCTSTVLEKANDPQEVCAVVPEPGTACRDGGSEETAAKQSGQVAEE